MERDDPASMDRLSTTLEAEPDLELAVLVGSRALGEARADSDWDIAIQWHRHIDAFEALGRTETLRARLAERLGVGQNDIDLIDMPRARLAMRAVIVEEGSVLKGEDSLAWAHYLQRTWRGLEQHAWEKAHAA
jgi:predicted nucleotidyltransferase